MHAHTPVKTRARARAHTHTNQHTCVPYSSMCHLLSLLHQSVLWSEPLQMLFPFTIFEALFTQVKLLQNAVCASVECAALLRIRDE